MDDRCKSFFSENEGNDMYALLYLKTVVWFQDVI